MSRKDVRPSPYEPTTLGPVSLRNRIIKAATSEGRSPDGLVTDDLIEFHRQFADGGVGMTTVAYCCVAPTGASAPGQIVMSEAAKPGLRKLTDAVHESGAAISAQLGHAGIVATKRITGVQAMGPSKFVNPMSMEFTREMSRTDIRDVIDQFCHAAQVAADSGFDAVELHFGHLYLPSSFLSPLVNRRTDEYGGDIDNRSRLVREIASEVRQAIGDRVAVIAKLNMDDGLPGSIWVDEALRTAQLLDDDATLDALELTQGSSLVKPLYLFRGDVPVNEMAAIMPRHVRLALRVAGKKLLGDYPYEDLYMLPAARQFVPVMKNTKLILLGGITSHEALMTGVDEGFDFMAIGRALLREPDLINQIATDPRKVSRCTHNNKCMATVFGKTHCVLDPEQRYGAVASDLPLVPAEGPHSVGSSSASASASVSVSAASVSAR
ncbi:NADH:flavin oxidoreductase [Gordonia sp. LSe1-13]|uniref:NADH:flavin oxidoreductase n=1 Tax=Gordonia sesuvii TaxID=3116777 RepID=A0ABU7MA05_9ACTN|nr:NADH:flavin oxidoreductase [Gordonia sp. LSe1-13]